MGFQALGDKGPVGVVSAVDDDDDDDDDDEDEEEAQPPSKKPPAPTPALFLLIDYIAQAPNWQPTLHAPPKRNELDRRAAPERAAPETLPSLETACRTSGPGRLSYVVASMSSCCLADPEPPPSKPRGTERKSARERGQRRALSDSLVRNDSRDTVVSQIRPFQ
eukprot:6213826-Pleurochrysis_carterae.AAC.1